MRSTVVRITIASALCTLPLVLAAAPPPMPPVKVGLWQVTMKSLDASGKEVPSPQQTAMARMTPERRAQMAESMKARGVMMPDENGAMKACYSKDTFQSGAWQQMAADTGCTTTYSNITSSSWKWHTSCTMMKIESDGETTFASSEHYTTKATTTSTVMGQTSTSTRVIDGKFLSASCGDIKPITMPSSGR